MKRILFVLALLCPLLPYAQSYVDRALTNDTLLTAARQRPPKNLTMRLLLLLFTSFLFLAAACTKADDDTLTTPLDELPPATQVGANTFGCLIDGVAFVNGGGEGILYKTYLLPIKQRPMRVYP